MYFDAAFCDFSWKYWLSSHIVIKCLSWTLIQCCSAIFWKTCYMFIRFISVFCNPHHAAWSLASCYYVRLLFSTSLDCSIRVTSENKFRACSSWIWSISSRNNILFTNVMRPFINVDGTRYCFILQILILKGMLLTIGLWSRSCRNILQGQLILIFREQELMSSFMHACTFGRMSTPLLLACFYLTYFICGKGEIWLKERREGK